MERWCGEDIGGPLSKRKAWQFWIDRGGTFTDIVARRRMA